MRLHRFLFRTLLLACVCAFTSSSAVAALVTWQLNPANMNGNVGSSSRTYTVSGYSMTARGYDNVSGPDTLHELYYKSEVPVGGAVEVGLGLVGTPSNELNINADGSVAQYIQLDLRSILSQGFTGGQISVASLQAGEGFRLFGSNTQGSLGTQLAGTWVGLAFDNQFVSVPSFGSFDFISIAAVSGRVLPVAFRAITPVPEMEALFPIVGLLAAVSATQILRRRRAARMQAVRF
jgi:hypothetical protein